MGLYLPSERKLDSNHVPHYIRLQDAAPSGNEKQIPSGEGIPDSVFGITFLI
jgi:hypothetical protein